MQPGRGAGECRDLASPCEAVWESERMTGGVTLRRRPPLRACVHLRLDLSSVQVRRGQDADQSL